jgi:pimeloyl-ACP methyl ester carboxylesterase
MEGIMKKLLQWGMSVCALVLAGCQGISQVPATKQMDVNGVSLSYVDQGSGAPIVFVHPALADLRVWDTLRPSVAKTHRFVAYDQRYFGTAAWPDKGERFAKATQVEDLTAFIRGLGAGPVHLVGWSMSADTVLLVAMRNPELVRTIFSYEPGGIEVTDSGKAKLVGDDAGAAFGPVGAAIKAGDEAVAAKTLVDGVENKPGSFDAAPPVNRQIILDNARTLAPMFGSQSPPITCRQLSQIKVPVAIAKGAQTRPFFAISADTAADCIPGVQRVVGPGVRHMWPVNDPKSFGLAVLNFVGRQ